jgi:phosphatidylserine/phosphatidylglycerophosphate/cardiolipin synthase-like enzyme
MLPSFYYSRPLLETGLLLVTLQLQAAPTVNTGFSPEGSAQQLVLRTLHGAGESIRLMGYTFTSPDVVRELISARARGVDVKVVLDAEGNRGRASLAAMNTLVNAGIALRTVTAWRIMHDKVIIVDGRTVSTGSFNFTQAAARANSENVLVVQDMPALAQNYLTHWQSRWDVGQDWTSSY